MSRTARSSSRSAPNAVPQDLAAELHIRGVDLYSLEYRRWLREIVGQLEQSRGETGPEPG